MVIVQRRPCWGYSVGVSYLGPPIALEIPYGLSSTAMVVPRPLDFWLTSQHSVSLLSMCIAV